MTWILLFPLKMTCSEICFCQVNWLRIITSAHLSLKQKLQILEYKYIHVDQKLHESVCSIIWDGAFHRLVTSEINFRAMWHHYKRYKMTNKGAYFNFYSWIFTVRYVKKERKNRQTFYVQLQFTPY